MSYTSRWKTLNPADTVERIEAWLEKVGLEAQRLTAVHTGSCVSSTLTMGGGYLFVNGKGGSEDLCWASAYGELMERIATRALHRFRFVDESSGTSSALVPDCVLVSRESFTSDYVYHHFGRDTFDYDKALATQLTFFPLDRGGVRCETFTSVLTGKEYLIPISLADVLIGTNGMSYGNDELEADQQALAELCERFANRIVVTERLTLPEFPYQDLHPHLRSVIEKLEERLALTIRVHDASLGYGLPVISVLVENPENGRYFVKFGAHFDPSVATERCLTELFQGRTGDDLSFLRERAYVENAYWQARNLDSILHNGDGFYPPEYFREGEVDPSSTWPINLKNNGEAVQYMQSILGRLGGDVFKRVYLTDPGYVVRYVVPGVSELTLSGQDKLQWRGELDRIRKILPGFGSLPNDEVDTILDFVERNCEHDMVSLLPMLPHALPASSRYRIITLRVLAFLREVLRGDPLAVRNLANNYTSHPMHDPGVAQAMMLVVTKIDKAGPQERRILVELFCEKVLRLPRLQDDDFCTLGECRCEKVRSELNVLRHIEQV